MAVLDANDRNFEELIQCDYAVVDFYGDYCGACELFAPLFEDTANDMPYIRFIHINVSHNPETARKNGIESIPTLFYYRNGERVHRSVGATDRENFNRHIAKMLYE